MPPLTGTGVEPLISVTDTSTVRTLPGKIPEPRGAGGEIATVAAVVLAANAADTHNNAADATANLPIVLARRKKTMQRVESFKVVLLNPACNTNPAGRHRSILLLMIFEWSGGPR